MAQTKKQRFRDEKRTKKQPVAAQATPAKKRSAAAPEETSSKKPLIIGGVVAALLAGAAAVVFVVNPFAPAPSANEVTNTPRSAQSVDPVTGEIVTRVSPQEARSAMLRSYQIRIEPDAAQLAAESCDSGEPATVKGVQRGQSIDVQIKCVNNLFTAHDPATGADLPTLEGQSLVLPERQ